jgi:hypothetical protein
MKTLQILLIIAFLVGCDTNRTDIAYEEYDADQARETSETTALETDSFRIGNKEIRDEMLELFEENNIQYSLSDDNLITISLADGDTVDEIYTDVRLTYIRRN